MSNNFLLKNDLAIELYNEIKNAPIYDYHCHLSPKEIYEDKVFSDIGECWLKYDHYKWRLMRSAGIDEYYITGNAPMKEKFREFSKAVSLSGASPVYHWCKMELETYFNITEPLCESTADEIYQKANEVIKEKQLSPRKIIELSNVNFIGTTDDITDNLEYHKKLKADKSLNVTIAPSFRTDNLLLIKREDYTKYIKELSKASGIEINDILTLKKALIQRLDFFKQNGCKFSDVGIPFFPQSYFNESDADIVFKKALLNNNITETEYSGFLGHMYLFLGKAYKERDIIMQLHLAVARNINSKLFKSFGADCGCDTIGDAISGKSIALLFDKLNEQGMPKTICYTLNPSMIPQLVSICGSFSNIRIGAAWWFCDNKRGIEETMRYIVEYGSNIGSFYGMLTDSRSFLSYTRHDYFRRILCSMVSDWVQNDGYELEFAKILIKKIAYQNIKGELQ